MDKVLKLYTYVDGVHDTPFPSEEGQVEIPVFRYDTKRMGGAPLLSATVMYPTCLDSLWTDSVYVSFGGERYFLKQTPTSSYSNEDSRYSHQVELLSERVILDNVYFFDVVNEENEEDGMVANGSTFQFFGDIHEFARRLALSLSYSNVGYDVVVDEGVSSESVLFSFSDSFFSNAIQESYNLLEIPYYFEGKTLHFGGSSNTIEEVFSYGVDNSLLSITKENANYKIVNRATATGSSDNIPFYYPNKSPLGDLSLETNSDSATFEIVNYETLSNNMSISDTLEYRGVSVGDEVIYYSEDGTNFDNYYGEDIFTKYDDRRMNTLWFALGFRVTQAGEVDVVGDVTIKDIAQGGLGEHLVYAKLVDPNNKEIPSSIDNGVIHCGNLEWGFYTLTMGLQFPLEDKSYKINATFNTQVKNGWYKSPEGQEKVDLKDLGIAVTGTPQSNDAITLKLDRYVKPSNVLLPSKYRETNGKERFYNATNNTYTDESGANIVFEFPYVGNNPKEHIFTVEDIKPSIKGMTNSDGLRVDMFSAFAYDLNDNDETYEDGEGSTNYKHPYFFAKLRKLDFNLFDHAIEGQPMRISFTSGHCGACEFEIGIDEESQKNTVQVDENGNLIYDDEGRVLCGVEGTSQGDVEIQDKQNDTLNNEVWIALRKEESTYGVIMPSVNGNLRPKPCTSDTTNDGDTFVILGINLPQEYILNAEERLENEIVKYLKDNNLEKFNFSIVFSRIFFEENPSVLASLSENSRIKISYNGEEFEQYISSYSYTMGEGDVLPEIRVELSESLSVSQNAMQNAVNEVKATMGKVINTLQTQLTNAQENAISKTSDDVALGVVDFVKGLKAGEGAKLEVLENNSAKLTIEYLDVTKKATFNSIEIQEKKHVGGQILVTNASIIVGEVEDFPDYYRCYFQTKGEDDKQVIFNTFALGDQAICQTFNAWGTRYYWRLVVGVGTDYIDLSKSDYDSGSMTPIEGDRVIQLGNRSDEARQNAIVIAAYGEEAPYIIQYKGINSYDLPQTSEDERIMTKLSPSENILTGLVRMTAGSKGLEMFEEWAGKQQLIDSKASGEDVEELGKQMSYFDYIKQALKEDTTILGGLIQSSILSLGYTDSEGVYHIMSGTNGVYDSSKVGGGIASWWGGEMDENSAKALIRFDGSGFLANKNITWDERGYGSIGGGLFTWGVDANGKPYIRISNDVTLGGDGDDSIETILAFIAKVNSWFEEDADGNIMVKNRGLYSPKFISSRGADPNRGGGGTGGGSSYLNELLDVNANPIDLKTGDMLVWDKASQKYIVINKSVFALASSLNEYQTKVSSSNKIPYAYISGVPTALKNPYALTIAGKAYDGSGEVSITAEDLGAITDLSDYYTKREVDALIPSLAGYATENWVKTQKYLTAITSAMVTSALGYTPYSTSNPNGYTSNKGTVTSVKMTVPTGFSVSGSPITSEGTLALAFANGYSLPTTTKQANWDTAYGWGNHASKGYATETFVNTAIANLINGAPTTLDTLKEIADALADNADVVEALESAIGTKADKTTVDALDTRLDSAEANISTNATNITAQGKTIASHTTSINTLTSDVSGLKTSVSDLEDLFDSDGKALKAVTADNATKLNGQAASYYATASSVTTLQGYFTNGVAKNADKLDGNDSTYFATASALTALTTRVSTAESNIASLSNNKLNKSVWDKFFEEDSNGNLKVKVGLYSPKFISSREADPNTGGGSGGAFSLYTWTQVKALTSEVGGVAPTAYALKQAYNEIGVYLDGKASTSSVVALTTRVASLESKATSVSVSQTLTTGTEIGKITIDGVSKALYAPSSIAWGSVTGKPSFATVATSGKYSDLSGLPTIPSAVTESTVSGWGFTKNAGTITGIKMNGASKGTSGVVDLGTVITEHQDLSGYQTKITSTNKLAYSLISGTPTSLPASDVYAWAKATTKPSYTAAEVGALATSGGTITGGVGVYTPLVIKSTNLSEVWIQFQDSTGTTHIGSAKGVPSINSGSGNQTLIHSGNIGSYNAGSATKLATPRTIWGQSFDGTGNVDGNLVLNNNTGILSYDSTGTARYLLHLSNNDALHIGHTSAQAGYSTYINGNGVYLRYGTSRTVGLILNSSGNVTIGSSDLASGEVWGNRKLYVKGYTANEVSTSQMILMQNAANFSGGAVVFWDKGLNAYGKGTIDASTLYLNSLGGNVLIGTTTDANLGKLQVNGSISMGNSGSSELYMNRGFYNRFIATQYNGSFAWRVNGGESDVMALSTAGHLLIGTTTDSNFHLDVSGNARVAGLTATTGTFTSNITATGTIYSATGVYSPGYVSARGADSSSDRRLKDNITPIKNALNYVLGTNYVSFDWKDTREKSIGIIAQEEMGREFGCLVQKHSENYSYLYGQHTALLGAAIQEEDKKVEELKVEIFRLKAKVNELETRLNS